MMLPNDRLIRPKNISQKLGTIIRLIKGGGQFFRPLKLVSHFCYPLVNDHIAGWNDNPIFNRKHIGSFRVHFPASSVTLPETNIVPENGWLEYYFPIGVPAYFQGRTVSFREGSDNRSVVLVSPFGKKKMCNKRILRKPAPNRTLF